jgi:hypothetical protein
MVENWRNQRTLGEQERTNVSKHSTLDLHGWCFLFWELGIGGTSETLALAGSRSLAGGKDGRILPFQIRNWI